MKATKEGLKQWIVSHLKDGVEFDGETKGTYGLIWFLKYPPNTTPNVIALKTGFPESLDTEKTSKDIDYLRREFRIWLDLPKHLNVVPAFGFDVALLERENGEQVRIPIMRMKRMDGSLEEWVTDRSYPESDRLIAIAQALNGLKHIYLHGIEGHGDLKPSNLLYSDFGQNFVLPDEGWPSKKYPWNIRVADLGWADAWVDLGFTTKAFRQYLAPERLEGEVVPEKSDIFSIGVILAELLLGRHPARNIRKANKSDGEWKRCIENADWSLQEIESQKIKDLIIKCLNEKPENRPTTQNCLDILCYELKLVHGLEIKGTLDHWNKLDTERRLYERITDKAWAARKVLGLGEEQGLILLKGLEEQFAEIKVDSVKNSEAWFELANSLLMYYSKEGLLYSTEKIDAIREQSKTILETILANVNPSEIEVLSKKYNENISPFECFGDLLNGMTNIAGLTWEQFLNSEVYSQFAKGALAFAKAAETRTNNDTQISPEGNEFLGISISLVPAEPTAYYFRALWKHSNWLVNSIINAKEVQNERQIPDDLRAEILHDLKQAIRLKPNWNEPNDLFKKVNMNT